MLLRLVWNSVSLCLEGITIEDVHRGYRGGSLTARRLTGAYLDRIAERDPVLNAIVTLNPGALAEADAMDTKLRQEGVLTGPLHGIPIVVKDQAETAGIPTAFGSEALRDWIPLRDATAVARLRTAGAIILGKAAMPDFVTSWHGHSSRSGITRNPYALDRDPGGSSGGTAAAVAGDLALLGLGEDTGGSLRVPASFCGLVALRTTPGVISRTGFCPLVREQDAPGPLTRTVRDLAITLDVLTGWDPEDPFTAAAAIVRRRGTFTDQLRPGGLSGARIGVLRDRFGTTTETERATTAVIDAALARMGSAGATLVDPVAIDGLDAHLEATSPYFLQSRRELNAFLAARDLPVNDVAELVTAGEFWPSLVLMKVIAAGPTKPESLPEYAHLLDARAAFQRAVVGVMAAHRARCGCLSDGADRGAAAGRHRRRLLGGDRGQHRSPRSATLSGQRPHRLAGTAPRDHPARRSHRARVADRVGVARPPLRRRRAGAPRLRRRAHRRSTNRPIPTNGADPCWLMAGSMSTLTSRRLVPRVSTTRRSFSS